MMANLERCVAVCNRLLRGEISAVETYDKALAKFAQAAEAATLQRIRDDHQASVDRLKSNIISMGGTPDKNSGAWGAFAGAVQSTANFLGDNSALGALLKGEKHGREEYVSALENDDVLSEGKVMIRERLLPRLNIHIEILEGMTREQEKAP